MDENFPELNKYINTLIQEAQHTPTKINEKKSTLGNFIVKLKKTNVKEKILV